MQTRRSLVTFVACLMTSLALAATSAQAQGPTVNAGGGAPVGGYTAPANAPKPKLYTACYGGYGCITPLDIYTKGLEWELPKENKYGDYVVELLGKTKLTIFYGYGEFGEYCEFYGVKDDAGYSSETSPGEIFCEAGEEVYFEDSWWAIKD